MVLITALFLVPFSHGEDLLPNPSFEATADQAVPGWVSRAWHGEAAARWLVDSPGRTGGHCLSIASAAGADAAWTATVPVEPHTFYRLRGWIKAERVRGATGALLNIQGLSAKSSPVTGTRDWTRVETVFNTGGAAELEVNCLFGGWGKSTGQAWYDDVALEKLGSEAEGTRAAVTIDTDVPSIGYSPLLFGGFLEHFNRQVYGGVFDPGSPLSDERGFRRDVIEALKELKVPVVRWPGGCYVSGYHWQDGVGPERQPTHDRAWGVKEPNTFGTDEFVGLCRLAGWEPFICTNAGNGTVQEMADWVAYCNQREGAFAEMRRANGHAQPLSVKIWSIGNENWGGHEIGQKSPKAWGPLVVEAAKAMKAIDPSIQLSAAGHTNRDWSLPLLAAAGDYLDYISIHHYWLPLWQKNRMPDYLTCIMESEGPEQLISDYIGLLEEAGYRGRIKIAFDEWNLRSWHHPGFPRKAVSDYEDPEVMALVKARDDALIASQYTMADALFAASFLNACLRHAEDVGMANIAPIVNTRGPLYVHPEGIVRRTHFHTLAMYANELEERVGKIDVAAGILLHKERWVPMIDAIATVNESGDQWAIALVNRHPSKEVTCTIRLGSVALDGRYEVAVLGADSPEAYNDIDSPDRVKPLQKRISIQGGALLLPPHSLSIVQARALAGVSEHSPR